MISRLLAAVLLLSGGSGIPEAHAQEVGSCPALRAAVDTAGRGPDLVIRASAHADEVRFRSVPEIDVRLTGGGSVLDTVRVIERRNLPDPVQPGVTYRGVFVAVEILGYLDVQCLLPGLALEPRGTAPDSARSAPALLCPPEVTDSIPRPPPRR